MSILSIGRARADWPRDVARWSTAGLLPVDHHPCLSPDELDSRIAEVGGVDVVLIDGGMASAGRELVRRAAAGGGAVIIVDEDDHDWVALGASAVMSAPNEPEALGRALDRLRPLRGADGPTLEPDPDTAPVGHVVAVLGHGGAGSSTIAHALAVRWGRRRPDQGVALADFSLRADQHVHHDITGAGPGVLDLVAGHHRSTMDSDAVRATTRAVSTHDLLTGVRHRRDWTALPPSGISAALHGLRRAYSIVIVDSDEELDGRTETGSIDLEERNGLSRAAVLAAGTVVLVARGDLLGLNRLCGLVASVSAAGIEPERLRVVINGVRGRNPATPTLRQDIAGLLDPPMLARRMIAVPHQRSLEDRRRDGRGPSKRFIRHLSSIDQLFDAEPAATSADAVPSPLSDGERS